MIKRVNTLSSSLSPDMTPPLRPYTVPVVHLDLGATGQCASAIIGVMSQPTGDKVCSLQVGRWMSVWWLGVGNDPWGVVCVLGEVPSRLSAYDD